MKKLTKITSWRKVSMALWSNPKEAIRYVHIELDVTDVPYATCKMAGISWTHLLVKWLAETVSLYPELNRHVINDSLYQKDEIDIFLRMSFPERDQLWGCYFRDCQSKSYAEIISQLDRVKEDSTRKNHEANLRERLIEIFPVWLIRLGFKLTRFSVIRNMIPDYLSPTISLSNLGSFKIPPFDPLPSFVLSTPILVCAGAIIEKDGKRLLPLSIGLDHRVIDGDLAADFLLALLKKPGQVNSLSL